MADPSIDQNLPSAGDVSVVFDETLVPEEDREEILAEIDQLVAEGSGPREVPQEFLRPQRSGVVFPVILNVIAAAAVVGGLYFINQAFRNQEQDITVSSQSYFSTEAQLIEQVRRESEAELARKDQEITQIQSQLENLDAEKQNLLDSLDEQVAERENELRQQLEAELAAERARLAGQGESEESINARLAEIEAQREAEYASQLEEFRSETQAELDALEAQLTAREAQLQQTLSASREERTRIAAEAASREQELREELGAEIEALEEAEQVAQARVQQLQALREEESLLADRVLGSFAVVVEDIQEGLSEEAISGLDSLERLLRDQRPVDADSARRRQTELALASTLRGLIQEVDVLRDNIALRELTTTEDEVAALEQERAAELISTAAEVVQLAEDSRNAGRLNEARALYRQALETIPSLDLVYPGILDLETSRRAEVMRAAVGEAQNLLAAGGTEAAITTYLAALREIAESSEDPVVAVADGIRGATTRNQQELLAAQQSIESEYRGDLEQRDARIATLNRDLLAAQNQVSTRDASISELQTGVKTLNQQLRTREAAAESRIQDLAAAQARVTELEDELASQQVSLQSELARVSGLESSLETSRNRIEELETRETALQAQISELSDEVSSLLSDADLASQRETSLQERLSELQTRVSELQTELEARPEVTVATDEATVATQAEIDQLTATIAGLRDQVSDLDATAEQLNGEVSQRESTITDLQGRLGTVQDQLTEVQSSLRDAENDRDSTATELEAARETVSGLQEQIAALRSQRDSASGETGELEMQIASLSEEVDLLQTYRDRIETLTTRYERAQSSAVRLAGAGNYESALNQLLDPLETDTANEVLPAVATNIQQIYSGLISQAEEQIAETVRTGTIDDVSGLTDQVKRNIDDAQGSVAVQSYLNREPDIQELADDIFEIIELASRDISAPEVDYRLLGSVSRITGTLIVVERLVALEPGVGDEVEIRRTPELGQEVPVALGTILEVNERRVLVSIDQIYLADVEPVIADVVYVAQE